MSVVILGSAVLPQRPTTHVNDETIRSKRAIGIAFAVLAVAFVSWFYHWTISSSGGFQAPGEEDYYNYLVRGWRAGHLYLSKDPSPEMLRLVDPYDPAQNAQVRLADASYYRGHYYLYFGPAPAAVAMLPYFILTGKELGTTTTIYAFCILGFAAASAVWLQIRHSYFPSSAPWTAGAGVLTLGLSTHVLALQRRPLVWELPIAAGFCFSMLALACTYVTLHANRRGQIVSMTLAGLSLGLAVGSRPFYVFTAVLFIPVLLYIRRSAPNSATWLWCAGGGFGNLTMCLGLLAAHNYARFDNPFEFGQNYQLTSVYESKMRHFSLSYVPHNAYIYYFHPPAWENQFPFLKATIVRGGPIGYLGDWNEAVPGLLVTFPFFCFALASPFASCRFRQDEKLRLNAFIASIGLFYGIVAVVMLSFFLAAPRYMADFTPSLALLASVGMLCVERISESLNRSLKGLTSFGIVTICIVTACAAIAASFDYHDRALQRYQPEQWSKWRAATAQWFNIER